jgi:hypothetical protein
MSPFYARCIGRARCRVADDLIDRVSQSIGTVSAVRVLYHVDAPEVTPVVAGGGVYFVHLDSP